MADFIYCNKCPIHVIANSESSLPDLSDLVELLIMKNSINFITSNETRRVLPWPKVGSIETKAYVENNQVSSFYWLADHMQLTGYSIGAFASQSILLSHNLQNNHIIVQNSLIRFYEKL